MTEKELISKIQELRKIEPSQNWVVFTKKRILREEFTGSRERTPTLGWQEFINGVRIIFQHKFAFASLLVVFVFVGVLGTFGFAQNCLPGDSLYSLKKITEKGRAVFVSEENQPRYNLGIVSKRLDDLTKIAESNRINNLASAIKEVQKSEEEAVKSLSNSGVGKNPELLKEIAAVIKKQEDQKQELGRTLGVAGLEENKETTPIKAVVELLIEDMENNSLTEEREENLTEAIKDYEEGNYSQALEALLMNQ